MKRHVWTRWLRALIPHTVRNVSHQTRSRRLSVEDLEIRLAPATRIWDGGGTTPNWGEAANWQGDALPQNGDDLLFPSGVAKTDTFNNIANSTYNLISFSGSGYRLAGLEITLGSTGPNTGYIVANLGTTLNTIDLDITMGGLAGNRQFFSVGTVGATLTINGALKGNTGVELSKDGPGILILTGNNQQFTGPISIVEGALSARHVNALGDTSAPTTVLSTFARSGQLQIEGITGDIQETLRLNGPGAANDGALLNVSGNNTWAGSIILDTSSIIGANTGTSLTVTGVISDSGAGQNLTKEGAGTIILDPLNTASGNTYRGQTIINDGILQIRHSLALGNDPVAVTNPLAGLVNNTVVASFPNRSGTLQLDFVANAQRIDPFVNPGNDGFTLPYESLTLNGPGIEGIHVFPKQPMPNGSTVTGALSNARGNNFVSQDVFLWSDDSTVLGDINRWSFGGNTLPTVGIGAEAGSTLTFTGHIVDTNLTGTPDYSLIKTRQGRVVFVNANSYRGKTEVLQGFLRIQDSQALGSASGGAIDGTWVFPQAALEIEADSIPDSQAGTYTDPPHGLPHLPTDIIISNELLRPMGDGFNNSGSVVNIRGVNELTGPFMMQQIIPRGNVSFVDTGASVGVLPDYAPYTLFDRSQLTISGEIQDDPGIASGDRLTKFGLGELVITNDNSGPAGYFGPTFIREGWVTARNSHALGQAINGPDTIQPATYVAPGAALHLKQTRDLAFQNINVPERLFITGNGITHRFPELSQRGALLNLGGNNVYSGIVTLVGTPTDDKVGIGADIDPTDVSVVTSSLRFINTIQEGLPDQPNSSTGYPAQATVPPTGIEKLGRKRVILQGPGTFSGNNDIVEGVLRIQNNIALGMLTGTTTVFDGSAIEVQGYTTANNGGLPGGIQVRETLILSGAGNVTADDPTHDFTSPVLVHTLTNRSDDNIWNGPITLQTDVSIDTQTNSRLALWKTISGTGGFTKYNDGKLILGGNNSYAGTTTINAGILNLQSPTALGTTTGGTVVANDAQIELQGDITIGGEQLTIQGDGVNTTPSFPLRWFPQGPGPINDVTWQGGTTTGRVNSVAVDPRDSNVMYVGAADGGLWRTKNNGYTWEQLIDNTGGVGGNQILFVGSIKVAPTDSNTIYVAFGDANNRSDSYYGRGVLKSSDYGRTWTLIQPPGNLFDRTTISQLVVDPINPNIIYVAVQGDGVNAAPPANYGIWRFNGTTWTNLTASGFNSTNRFSDLVVYDASGQLAPNNRVIAFAIGNIDGSNAPAVYISTDAGASFTSASFPTTPDSGFVDRNGRIKIGSVRLSGNQIQFLAAITYPVNAARQAQGTSGTFRELLTTTATYDPATTLWTVATWGAFGTQPSPQGSNAGYQADQGQFQSVITVNPNNPNYIFLAGFGGTTTTGPLVWNGTAWIDVDPGSDGKGPHNLYYAAAWRPDNTLIVGTAGGIWQLNNNTPPAAGNNANWVNKNGNFLQITQFTGFDVHPFNPFIAVGGSKDNGTEIFGDSPYWTNVEDGDGTVVAINNVNPNIIYRRLNNNTLRRSLDGGVTWAAVGSANGLATFTLDRNNPSRMLIGVGTSIRETKNAEGAATFIELGNNANNGLGNISLIGLANRQGAWQNDPSFPLAVDNGDDAYDPATIYLMTSNGVWVTKNSGQLWVQRNTGLPGGFSTDYSAMVVDPRNRDTVYLVRNVFGGAKVLRSTDAGRSWTDFSGDLPDLPTWSLTINPRTGDIFVGNDNGVYQLPGGSGSTWTRYGVGMPNVQVRNLVVNTLTNTLSAGTYGRGMFELFLDNSAANSGSIRGVSGSSVWSGNVILTGNTKLQAELGAQVNFTGSISDQSGSGPFTISKTGQGRVVFSGVNSYGGVTDIQEGVLVVRNPFALGDSSPTANTIVQVGAVLELQTDLALEQVVLNGNGQSFNSRFTGALRNVTGDNTFTGTLILNTPAAGPSNNSPLPSDTALQLTIGVDSGSTLTIGTKPGLAGVGTIQDATTPRLLTKELTGTLILNTENSYQGLTQINQGAIRAAHNLALGGFANGTRVRNGAQLELALDSAGNPITITNERLELSGTGLDSTGAIENISGNNVWAGDIILSSITGLPAPPPTTPPLRSSINVVRPQDTLTISGSISEEFASFGLDKIGPGRLTLTNNNTYTGTTNILAGALRAEAPNALGSAGTLPSNGTRVTSGASLELNHATGVVFAAEEVELNGRGISPDNAGALRNVGGNNTWTGNIILNSTIPVSSGQPGSTVHIGADGTSQLTIDGNNLVRDPSSVPVTNKAAILRKVGTGTVVFDDANSYVGETYVDQGVLKIRNAGALGPIINEVQTINIVGPGGFFTLTFNGSTTSSLPAAATATDIQNALNALPSMTTPGGSVVVSRNGNLVTVIFSGGAFAGTNQPQITGVGVSGTTITTATVQTGGLSAGTTVNSGGTLAVENNITVTNELLTLNGAGQGGIGALYNAAGNNTWSNTITLGSNSHIGVALAGDNLTIDRSIVQASSNLGVTKVGLGTLTYAGGAGTSNSYTGLTTINEGTLALNKTGGAVALNGNLTIGDGVAPNATALWQTANQVIDSATIRVESDGLLNLNGLAETIATLRILDGMAQTGNNGQLTVGTLLDMVGGTATIGTSGQINLGGSVSGNSSGVGPALIQGAGNLSLNGSNRDFTIANGPNATDMRITAPISGSGVGVNKLGDGLLELNALNTYTGTTTIEAGTVQVGGTIGAVDLDGGTLSGTGTTGAVNGGTPATAAEGIVSPGNTGPGILNTGASVWGGNTDFRVELNTPSGGPGVGYDQLRVTGSINLGNLSLGQSELVGIVGPGVGIGDSFTIITATGGVSGQFVQGNTVFIDGKKFSVVYNPNNVILTRIKADVNMVLVSSTAGNQSVYGQDVTFTVTVTPETGAGPLPLVGDTVTFTLDGVYVKPPQNLTTSPGTASMNPFTDFGIILPPNASHSVLASFSGDVDFNSSFVFLDPEQSVLKASTQVNASVSPANPVFGETVTINVNIVDLIPSPKLPAAAIPTGTVTFTIDGVVGSPELLTGATISRQLTGLSVGAHTVEISYSGDGNYLPSSTTQAIQITVNRANTEVSLSPVPSSPIPKGDTVQFFATVTAVAPGAGIPSGTVFFYDGPVNGGILLGSDDLDSFGIASIATNSLGVGNHTITAFYAGNTDFNSDESSIPFTIGPALTQTVITSTPSSTVFGQTVTFTAGVTSANPVNGVPVGTVTFIIDGGLVVSPNLSVNSLGSASWSINTLGAGPHSVVAQFNANTNFATSSSDPLNYTVNQANTKVAVSSSINPGAAGDPVELRAAVSAIAPGVGAVTGNVKFFVNGVERGTAPIVAGVARLPVTFSSQGTFAITATFVGSTNYAPSNSNATPFSQRIVAFGSTTTFVNPTAANPTSVTGQKVSFVAEVRNKITNALVTSGTVTFFINGVAQTPVALNANGRAVLGRPYNPGSYTITARYNGNANVASSSTSKILTVSKANTAVVLTPSRNPSYTNVASSVTATVNPVAPGGGIPTGSVTFSVNGNPRAPINLTNGKATLNLGLLSVGNYTITAIYNGSPNYNGSLTTTFQLTVTNPPPASKLTAAPTGAVFANTPFVVRATARDSSNQIVTGYNIPATIKLVSAPAGASFTGNKNVTFVNGVATFTNLVVNRSGRYVFRVTTGNLTIDFVVVVASRLL